MRNSLVLVFNIISIMEVYLYSIGSVILVSLISLVGVFTLGLKEQLLRKYLFILVSLAVGALLGDAFIHLIPEAFEEINNPTLVSFAIIGGIFIFFVLEKILHWHHHDVGGDAPHPMGRLILISDGVHNFLDGMIIAGSFLISVEVGIATTIAVILHEIPQEIGDFGILLHAGYSKAKALWLNFLSALLAAAGALMVLIFNNITESFALWLLPITAGGFIYIAIADLIPEMHKTKKVTYTLLQLAAVAVGIAMMTLLLVLE